MTHMYEVHSQQPNFHVSCGIENCPNSYRIYHSFYKHVLRHHADHYKEMIFRDDQHVIGVPVGMCGSIANDDSHDADIISPPASETEIDTYSRTSIRHSSRAAENGLQLQISLIHETSTSFIKGKNSAIRLTADVLQII